MTDPIAPKVRNGLIALAAVLLSVVLFVGNQYRTQSVSLEALASRSVAWETSQANAKPTLVEFYADWCSSCRAMAPQIAALKSQFQDQVNFVMLNVDNPKWLPELTTYRVNGIPHFVFLDGAGSVQANSIGEQPLSVMESNLIALRDQGKLSSQNPTGRVSDFSAPAPIKQPDPRSHA